MLEISRSAYNALSEEIEVVELALLRANEELEAARDKGDLSENSEYDQSKLEVERLQKRRNNITTLLQTSKVVNMVSNAKIQPGTLIEVRLEGIDDPTYSADLGLLMFDNVGHTVTNGKITPDAPLGSAIKDGASGRYEIIGYDSKRYASYVTIVSQDRLGEFLDKYPTDVSGHLKSIFRNSGKSKE